MTERSASVTGFGKTPGAARMCPGAFLLRRGTLERRLAGTLRRDAALLRPRPRELAQLVLVPAPGRRFVEHRVELRRVHPRHLLLHPLAAEPLRNIENRHPLSLATTVEAVCGQGISGGVARSAAIGTFCGTAAGLFDRDAATLEHV
jgi:hypothetical protein